MSQPLRRRPKTFAKKLRLGFRDNGPGIPPEVREKMFNPFFTTKPAGGGTGLGLSITHDIIVKQHSLSIEVDTQPGTLATIHHSARSERNQQCAA
jgi:signal transduction histidine kinase